MKSHEDMVREILCFLLAQSVLKALAGESFHKSMISPRVESDTPYLFSALMLTLYNFLANTDQIC